MLRDQKVQSIDEYNVVLIIWYDRASSSDSVRNTASGAERIPEIDIPIAPSKGNIQTRVTHTVITRSTFLMPPVN